MLANEDRSSLEDLGGHREVCDALCRLDPAGLLAWAVLDQKSEKFVTVGLVAELNKNRRIAVSEHDHIDLVLFDGPWSGKGLPRAAYETKCDFLCGLRRRPLNKTCRSNYGENLRLNLKERDAGHKLWRTIPVRGGLFYLIEVTPGAAQSTYSKRNELTGEEGLIVVEECVGRAAMYKATSKCSTVEQAGGARVRIHTALFDASPS